MPLYHFTISGRRPYRSQGGHPFSNDAEAWAEARSLVRDAEETLTPDEEWVLEVLRESVPIFRISVKSETFG
ncbi:hypothetical protein ABIB82_004284 [Bradyrhizobium sp. i1.8.4]|uniref:DUF6894 family protein n=1 Tax=unclassified Bradyrhizobium TaxID=2631580 RepID=UPI003D1A3978